MFSVIPISAFKDNYIWCIVNNALKECVVVDPGDALPVMTMLEEKRLILKGVLITHHHWDHTGGVKKLQEKYNIDVYAPESPHMHHATVIFKEETSFTILDSLTLKVLFIPGHTLDHVAYFGANKLFCGDTLFSAGCGRIFEGTPEMMHHSLMKLKALPDETEVYCGHEYTISNLKFASLVDGRNNKISQYLKRVEALRDQDVPSLPSSIGLEKEVNPFLRTDCLAVVESVKNHAKLSAATEIDIFKYLRLWKDDF